MTDKTDALVAKLNRVVASMLKDDEAVVWWIGDVREVAEALAAPAEGASAEDYERELSAVMPEDFKDWHQNDKREWPAVAAAVIRNLREREATAWDAALAIRGLP